MTQLFLDHIVILVPYQTLLNLPSSLTTNFTITPGGRHAGNLTINKLITLKDGSYIELISFISSDSDLNKDHWWGQKKPGIIDFAFTSTDGDVNKLFEDLQKRFEKEGLVGDDGKKFGYGESRDGGRLRDDGVELKWKVTFPKGATRGEVPFFCHDVTDRSLRVPGSKENTTHPCGVFGVKSMSIMVASGRVDELVRRYEAILGVKAVDEEVGGSKFEIGSVNEGENKGPILFVRAPKEEWQKKRVEERGYLIGDLVFGGKDTSGFPKRIDLDIDLGGLFVETRLQPRTAE